MIYLRDGDTGKFIYVDETIPSGTLVVIDANTGSLAPINLSGALTALGWVNDADSGKLVDLTTGIVYVVDANTGNVVPVNVLAPSGIMSVNDFNTGKIIQIDLSTGFLIPFINE